MVWRAVVAAGLFFGLAAGLFGLGVLMITVFVAHELSYRGVPAFTGSALAFLIIGGAGRVLGGRTAKVLAGWWAGALAGVVSEVIRAVGGAVVIVLSPAGQAAFARIGAQLQGRPPDPALQLAVLGLDIGVATLFSALVGALGAWSAVRFPPGPKT